MEPLNVFLTKSNYVLLDLNKEENNPSKCEKIDAVIENVIKKNNESDLTVAESSAEIAPIQKLLRSIGAHTRKSVDSETFKLFQVQVSKVRQNRKDFEEYERFDHELDDFLYEFRDGISGDAAIKRAGKFINDNLRWFYSSANKMGGGAKVELAQEKLKQLSDLAGKTELPLTKNPQKQIARILPKPSRIPQIPSAVWNREMLTFLPSRDPGAIKSSYEEILQQTQELTQEQRLKVLAGWINNNKIRLSISHLPKKEIQELAPFLTYMDLIGLEFNGSELEDLIESAAPKLVSLHVEGINMYRDGIERLPERLPKLKNLSIESSLIPDLSKYLRLEKLSCQKWDNLKEIRHPNLKVIKCSYCKNLTKIDCPQLNKLNVKNCEKLAAITSLPKLELIECNACDNLKKIEELPSLREIRAYCYNINSLSHLPKLKKMYISGPKNLSIENFPELEELEIYYGLKVIRKVPKLKILKLRLIDSFVEGSSLKELNELEELVISGVNMKGLLELPKLKKLELSYSDLNTIGTCPKLKDLTLLSCYGLATESFIKSLRFLESLNWIKCHLSTLPHLPSLSTINLNVCPKLLKLPEAPRLTEMTLKDCPKLTGIPYYPLLEKHTIEKCPNITTWPTNMLY